MSDPGAPSACPRCGESMVATTVRTMFWRDDRPAIVEDIPANVCSTCVEQYYDEDVSDALRRLAEDGFPAETAQRQVVVPVFSLKDRLRQRMPLPEDCHLD